MLLVNELACRLYKTALILVLVRALVFCSAVVYINMIVMPALLLRKSYCINFFYKKTDMNKGIFNPCLSV
jgi:hypothetical protein